MSVANIYFMDDRILCQTDTVYYDGKRPAGLHDTKAHVFGRMAITTRGLVRAGNAVKAVAADFASVDEARPALDEVHAFCLDSRRDGDDAIELETYLMGWSDERQDLVVWCWDILKSLDRVRFTERKRGMYLAPSFMTVTPVLPESMPDERLVKVAKAQYDTAQKMGLNMCIGGEMTVTDITAGRIEQRVPGYYPNHYDLLAQFGHPTAEAEHGSREPKRYCT